MSAYLGVQLYSVRDDIGPGLLAGTLRRLAGLGFTHVEHFRILDATDEFARGLREAGLAATAAHADVTSADSRDALFAAARRLGLDTLIVPWTEPSSLTTAGDVRRRARDINDAAARAADHGLTVGYHNHDFEFSQHVGGVPAYQVLTDALSADVVLELDTHWASAGGADVFSLLPALAGRVRYLHVTNEPPDADDPPVPGERRGGGREKTSVDLTGRMDSVVALGLSAGALPVAEIVVHDADVFPVLERNAAYFLGLQGVRS